MVKAIAAHRYPRLERYWLLKAKKCSGWHWQSVLETSCYQCVQVVMVNILLSPQRQNIGHMQMYLLTYGAASSHLVRRSTHVLLKTPGGTSKRNGSPRSLTYSMISINKSKGAFCVSEFKGGISTSVT